MGSQEGRCISWAVIIAPSNTSTAASEAQSTPLLAHSLLPAPASCPLPLLTREGGEEGQVQARGLGQRRGALLRGEKDGVCCSLRGIQWVVQCGTLLRCTTWATIPLPPHCSVGTSACPELLCLAAKSCSRCAPPHFHHSYNP